MIDIDLFLFHWTLNNKNEERENQLLFIIIYIVIRFTLIHQTNWTPESKCMVKHLISTLPIRLPFQKWQFCQNIHKKSDIFFKICAVVFQSHWIDFDLFAVLRKNLLQFDRNCMHQSQNWRCLTITKRSLIII